MLTPGFPKPRKPWRACKAAQMRCQNERTDQLAMPFSEYLAYRLLNWHRGTAAPAPPARIYISLHSALPGPDGTQNDVTASVAGARGSIIAASWSAPTSIQQGADLIHEISNTAVVSLSASAAGAATVTYFGCWDAAVGGNFLQYGVLTNPLTIAVGDVVRFAVGGLTLREI